MPVVWCYCLQKIVLPLFSVLSQSGWRCVSWIASYISRSPSCGRQDILAITFYSLLLCQYGTINFIFVILGRASLFSVQSFLDGRFYPHNPLWSGRVAKAAPAEVIHSPAGAVIWSWLLSFLPLPLSHLHLNISNIRLLFFQSRFIHPGWSPHSSWSLTSRLLSQVTRGAFGFQRSHTSVLIIVTYSRWVVISFTAFIIIIRESACFNTFFIQRVTVCFYPVQGRYWKNHSSEPNH